MEKGSFPNEELQDALKKVLSVMTVGIDLSGIYTEILMFSYINDIISKKMIYFYLTTYCELNEDIAMMALNTFLKDCASIDGKIRGLALRTLCSLKISSALEYIQQQVMLMLEDRDSYVRKIAVMGLLRLYYINNEFFEEHNLIDRLYTFLKDPHKHVVSGAISAIEEILYDEGGMSVNSKIVMYLMNRFNDFDCYGKSQITALLNRYTPQNKDEMYNIMNLLEDNLKKSSIPLRLMIISLFVKFTQNDPVLLENVLGRIAPELISMSCYADDEDLFVILNQILQFVRSPAKIHYTEGYKLFFCKGSENTYNAKIKIEILTEICTQKTVLEILEEFSEYTSEHDIILANEAVKGLTRLMLRFPDHSLVIMKRLLIFIKIGRLELINSILESIKNVIPFLPEFSDELMLLFENAALENTDENVTISLLRIFAQIPEKIKNCPYIIEIVLNNVMENEINYSRHLFLSLLTCIVYVFLKRPGETFPILTKLFQFFFESENKFSNDIDISERAMFYYNALKYDVNGLKELTAVRPVYEKPIQTNDTFLKFFNKFGMNDLQIIYLKTSDKFVKPLAFFNSSYAIKKKVEEVELEKDRSDEDSENDEIEKKNENIENKTLIAKKSEDHIDLLELDLIGTNVLPKAQTEHAMGSKKGSVDKPFELDHLCEAFEYDDDEFQLKWGEMTNEFDNKNTS